MTPRKPATAGGVARAGALWSLSLSIREQGGVPEGACHVARDSPWRLWTSRQTSTLELGRLAVPGAHVVAHDVAFADTEPWAHGGAMMTKAALVFVGGRGFIAG